MAIVFRNNATTALASDITNSATSITVTDGSKFPSITGSDYFYCTFDDGTNNEIVKVTAISGNTLTVVRAQDNTTARAFSTGDIAELRLTAAVLETFSQLDEGEITADEFIGDLRGAVIFKAQAGEAVSKGDVVYVSGITGNTPVVSKADADDSAKMPAFGLILTTAALNASTEVVTFGTISGVDTSAFSLGDTLYVSTTAGTLTATKPAGESALIQNIGKVQRAHASAGSIKVGGAGRTNDVPNLNDGNIFIGNGSNQSSTASLNTKIEEYLDGGTSTPTFSTLNVSGNTTLTGDLTVNGTTTSLNTNTLDVEDKNITLNYSTGDSSASADGSGITIQDAVNSTTDATILWDATNDRFDFSHGVTFPDNKKAIFGTGSDLEIYHDGSHSYIKDAGTGQIKVLAGTNFQVLDTTGTNFAANFNASGESQLYYNGNLKLKTTASGIDVTGTVTADGLTLDSTNGKIYLPQTPSTFNWLGDPIEQTGILIDPTNDGSSETIGLYTNNKKRFDIDAGGDISFYDDTGTTQGLFWDASAERLGIGTTSPSELLHIYNTGGAGNDANVLIEADGPGVNAKLTIDGHVNGGQLDLTYRSNTQSKTVAMKCLNDGSFRIDTLGSEAMRIVGNDVGIGTDAPIAKLHVESANNYNGTNFESNPHLAIDNGTPTNHTAVLMFESSGTDASNKRSGITGGNYYSNKHGLGFFGDLASKDRSATPDMFVNSSGNIGIGTSSPSAKLHVSGTTNLSDHITLSRGGGQFITKNDNSQYVLISGGNAGDSGQIILGGGTNGTYTGNILFRVGTTTTGEAARFDSSGNFGIGTTPLFGHKFSVQASTDKNFTVDDNNGTGISLNAYNNSGSNVELAIKSNIFSVHSATAERFRITNGGNVGIGTDSPTQKLEVDGAVLIKDSNTEGTLYLTNTSVGVKRSNAVDTANSRDIEIFTDGGGANVVFSTNGAGSAEMVVSDSGNVGIGTDNPVVTLNVDSDAQNEIARFQGANAQLRIDNNTLNVINLNSGGSGDALSLSTGGSEAIRIEDNQNVGIGTTAPDYALDVRDDANIQLKLASTTATNNARMVFAPNNVIKWNVGVNYNDNELSFYDQTTATTPVRFEQGAANNTLVVDSNSRVGIGTNAPAEALHIQTANDTKLRITKTGTDSIYAGVNTSPFIQASSLRFMSDSSTERARIDSSGNLLVGTTDDSLYNNGAGGNTGVLLRGSVGNIQAARSGGAPIDLNRLDSDGDIAVLQKDGSAVGRIGSTGGDLYIGRASSSSLRFQGAGIRPSTGATLADATYELGGASARFTNLYLSNQVYINGTSPNIRFTDSDTGADSQITASSGYGALVLKADYNNETASSYIGFEVDGAEKGRIWSAGLLVGKTTGDFGSTAGSEYRTGGNSYITADNTQPLRLNRLTSDGTLLEFRRDNSTRGSIGVFNDGLDRFYIVGDNGLKFKATDILPCTSTGANNDDALDLGASSTRFKDLHLSGQANVGTINNIAIKANETDFDDSILISTTGATGTLSGSQNNTGLGNNVFVDLTTANNSTAIGESALANLTTGSNNTAIGSATLKDITTASGNTAVGVSALVNNTASENTAVGKDAARVNTTGTKLVAVGFEALELNTTGNGSTAIGYEALRDNTEGTANTGLGQQAAKSNTTGIRNVALGYQASLSQTTANANASLGYQALYTNVTSSNNTALGAEALRNSTDGPNTAVGAGALKQNTTGYDNTSVGQASLNKNTTGIRNVAVGASALLDNTTGNSNTALGYSALANNTTGFDNISIGHSSLITNTTGARNIAIGNYALQQNTTANDLVAIGHHALIKNTTGGANVGVGKDALRLNTTGNNNTALGFEALELNTTGYNNTALGFRSLQNGTTSASNVAVGNSSMNATTTGTDNVSVGTSSLSANTSGSNNTALGRSAGDSITTGSNNTCIGYQADTATATSTNSITLGDANITTLRCNTQTISALSDARDKANVEDLQLGVEFIKDLRPVSFTWDRRDGSQNGVEDFGFIAQELDAVQEKHNEAERLGLVLKDNPDKLEASYGKLVPMLVKAIQELSQEVEELKQKLGE